MNTGSTTRLAAHAAMPLLVLATLFPAGTAMTDSLFSGGRKDARSISTDTYEVDIQKNGAIRVRDTNSETIFENAAPTVTLEGEDAPRALKVIATQT